MSDESAKPIGVFDSGLGGLTVLKELSDALPNEEFIYLGDVARLPYGTKSPSIIARYAGLCVAYLMSRGVKLIVIACNTATATALPILRKSHAIPIHGVIEPGVVAALKVTKAKKVLVLATPSTVSSKAYLHEFKLQDSAIIVEQLPCALLVPLAEEGWFDHSVTVTVIQNYLARVANQNYDTVVLGCTHYPLLLPSFRKAVAPKVSLVHGGGRLASEVKGMLTEKKLLRTQTTKRTISFAATDCISSSVPLVKSLFGDHCDFLVVDL